MHTGYTLRSYRAHCALRVLGRQPGAVDGFEQMLRHVAVMNKDTAALGGVPINSLNDVFDDLENNTSLNWQVGAGTRTIIGQSPQADDTTAALNADARQVLILHFCTVSMEMLTRHLLACVRCRPAVGSWPLTKRMVFCSGSWEGIRPCC